MKKIFNLLLIGLIVILTTTLSSCGRNNNTLVVAMSPDYAPFQFIDPRRSRRNNNHIVGADVNLANEIAYRLGKRLVIMPMQFRETLVAVQMRRADIAISGFSWTEARAQTFAMSRSYRIHSTDFEGLLTLENRNDEFDTLQCFNNSNVTIAVQNGSLQELLVLEHLPNANVQRINAIQDGVMLLENGNVDAVAVYSGTAFLILRNNPNLYMDYNIRFTSPDEDMGLHVIARKDNQDLMGKIDDIIKNHIINEDYTLDRFVYWMYEARILAAEVADHVARRRGE